MEEPNWLTKPSFAVHREKGAVEAVTLREARLILRRLVGAERPGSRETRLLQQPPEAPISVLVALGAQSSISGPWPNSKVPLPRSGAFRHGLPEGQSASGSRFGRELVQFLPVRT